MRTVIGQRVYVVTPLFSDWGTVVDHVPDPTYPIHVELENGDDHGHKYTRVNKNEIQEAK